MRGPHRRLLFVYLTVRARRVAWAPKAYAPSEAIVVSRYATVSTYWVHKRCRSCTTLFGFLFGRGPLGETVCVGGKGALAFRREAPMPAASR